MASDTMQKSMSHYENMWDCGIEWIGTVPNNWKLSTIGSVYQLRNEKVSDKDYPPLSVTMNGVVPQLATAAKTDAHDARKLVKSGDFVINSRSDRRGSCGISPYTGSVSLINTVLEPREKMNAQYYNWLFHTVQFADEFYKNGHGIVDDLWTTGWQDMKRIIIPMPPLDLQKEITTFLNQKCTQIDSIILQAKTSIEEYKVWKTSIIYEATTKGLDQNVEMKDSGIEWIGEIPSDWKIIRLKFLGSARNGLTYTPSDISDKNNGTLVLRSSNIQNGTLSFNDNVYVGSKIPEQLWLRQGDIVICSRNGSKALIGKNAYIESDISASFGAFMMVFRSFIPESKYVYWLLNSGVFGYYLGAYSTTTINQLTRENINNMYVPFCTDPVTRHNIALYLDKKCSEIDKVIAEKNALISDLEAYKKSLIFEVVTGKRKVV